MILKRQQRFESKRHNVFNEEINKIALSSNDGKILQSTDSVKTHAYGASKNLLRMKEKVNATNNRHKAIQIKQYWEWLILVILQKKT